MDVSNVWLRTRIDARMLLAIICKAVATRLRLIANHNYNRACELQAQQTARWPVI